MNRRVLSLFLVFHLLMGCSSHEEKYEKGSLSQMRKFSVYAYFSPYEKWESGPFFNILVDSLKAFGEVEIVDACSESVLDRREPLIFLSLGGYQQQNSGRIEVIDSVFIEANDFKMDCPIWHVNYGGRTGNSSYPVIEEEGITFRRDSSLPDKNTHLLDSPEIVLKQMIADFARDYRRHNLEGQRPHFRIYTHI